ncbi:MAG TPA: hypothetical protein RMH99_06270 [Sandaracinaceae bacterium LLY-WYZ-13_1]|nr:hypothetical protein [Sandaracinaceae bacterium LLY-WYZ-13_1]
MGVSLPRSCVDSPEGMFAPLVERRPELTGHFRTVFETNADTGAFIERSALPMVIQAVEGRMKELSRRERERFEGLRRVLRAADRHGLAFWEATDLGVVQTRPELLEPPPKAKEAKGPSEAERWKALLDEQTAAHGEGVERVEAILRYDGELRSQAERWLAKKAPATLRADEAGLRRLLDHEDAALRRRVAELLGPTYGAAKAKDADRLRPVIEHALAHEDPAVVRGALAVKLAKKHLSASVFETLEARLETLAGDEAALLGLAEWVEAAALRSWKKGEALPALEPFFGALLTADARAVRDRIRRTLLETSQKKGGRNLREAANAAFLAHAEEEVRAEDLRLLLVHYDALSESARERVCEALERAPAPELSIRALDELLKRAGAHPELVPRVEDLFVHPEAAARSAMVRAADVHAPRSVAAARERLALLGRALRRAPSLERARGAIEGAENALAGLAGAAPDDAVALVKEAPDPFDEAVAEVAERWRDDGRGADADAVEEAASGRIERAALQALRRDRGELLLHGVPDADPFRVAEAVVATYANQPDHGRARVKRLVEEGHGDALPKALEAYLRRPRSERVIDALVLGIGCTLENAGDPRSARRVAEVGFEARPNPDFLYNQSCANQTAGDVDEAARVLARAIEIDPKQAADARGDTQFAPYLEHPALAPLLRADQAVRGRGPT